MESEYTEDGRLYEVGNKTLYRQLIQIFEKSTWDGNLISKSARTRLVELGLVQQVDGWNIITAEGVKQAVKWSPKDYTKVRITSMRCIEADITTGKSTWEMYTEE
jgi:hypothetical protein